MEANTSVSDNCPEVLEFSKTLLLSYWISPFHTEIAIVLLHRYKCWANWRLYYKFLECVCYLYTLKRDLKVGLYFDLLGVHQKKENS